MGGPDAGLKPKGGTYLGEIDMPNVDIEHHI
jgi:hypothetical protein